MFETVRGESTIVEPLVTREDMERPWAETGPEMDAAVRRVGKLVVHNQLAEMTELVRATSALLEETRGKVPGETWGGVWALTNVMIAALRRQTDPQLIRELGNPLVQEMVALLDPADEGLQMNVLGEKLKRQASVISKAAARMADHLAVTVREEGRSKILRLTPEARRVWRQRQEGEVRDGEW